MLVSYAFFAKDNLASLRAAMPCGRLLIDSGAFTALSTGKRIELAAYADFLTTWQGAYDHAVTLDVIGDPAATARNTRKLQAMGHRVMPVFTRGGTVADFDAMVKDSGYVCVGGGVGMPTDLLVRRLRALQLRAQEHGGGIHALGVGNLDGLRKIRPYSADASNVSSAFRFGTVIAYDGRRLLVFQHTLKAKLRQHLHLFKAQGLGPQITELARTGRQPGAEGREALMRGLSVAYAAADEDAARYGVPVPHGVDDSQGTHMYSAITGMHLAPMVARLDKALHSGEFAPPLWQRYAEKHARQCRAKVAA